MTDTQNPGGWPDASKPGVPLEPQRDGWHWLQFNDDRPIPTAWIAEIDAWASGAAYSPEGVVELGFRYVAPCLTPAEVAARVAAARREGVEAALAAVDAEPEPEGDMPAKLANTDKRILVLATVRATKRGIDGRIRALLEDGR